MTDKYKCHSYDFQNLINNFLTNRIELQRELELKQFMAAVGDTKTDSYHLHENDLIGLAEALATSYTSAAQLLSHYYAKEVEQARLKERMRSAPRRGFGGDGFIGKEKIAKHVTAGPVNLDRPDVPDPSAEQPVEAALPNKSRTMIKEATDQDVTAEALADKIEKEDRSRPRAYDCSREVLDAIISRGRDIGIYPPAPGCGEIWEAHVDREIKRIREENKASEPTVGNCVDYGRLLSKGPAARAGAMEKEEVKDPDQAMIDKLNAHARETARKYPKIDSQRDTRVKAHIAEYVHILGEMERDRCLTAHRVLSTAAEFANADISQSELVQLYYGVPYYGLQYVRSHPARVQLGKSYVGNKYPRAGSHFEF